MDKFLSTWHTAQGYGTNVFFTHANHLGSASWITDQYGTPVQYIHYAPYGTLIANQCATGYDERFKFTGKERDSETNYDYFGARYYSSPVGIWLSVDPLADKYPNVTPYLYCNANPVMLIDPDGRETKLWVETEGVGHTWVTVGEGEDIIVYSFGRYGKNDFPQLGKFCPSGEGVLLRLTGDDAQDYINSKAATNPMSIAIDDVSDEVVMNYFDQKFNESTTCATRENPSFPLESSRVISHYSILSNNCTTVAIDALKEAGTQYFNGTIYVPSQKMDCPISNYVPLNTPAGLWLYMTIKK